jgi:hypothetical protein
MYHPLHDSGDVYVEVLPCCLGNLILNLYKFQAEKKEK